ncbi:MAG: DUF1073 domain-containing protein [Clostridia bacterium]|nr:DUF1073 domain-containing protein [Clostridia bacterium]
MDSEKQKAIMKRYLRAVEKQTGIKLKNAYETYNYNPGDYRMDEYRADGYVNMINNYGTSKDTMEHYHYERELPIMDGELAVIYEGNAIFARIIDAPAEDAMRKGFTLKDVKDDKLIDFYKESLRNLSFEEQATDALRWQRLFGGSMIVMLINDGRGIDEPVDWDNIESVDEMRVYDRSVIVPDITTMFSYSGHDPFKMRGSRLGQPERYYVASKYGCFWVHESRVLLFKGGRLPEKCSNFTYEMWGMPEYLRIKRELRNVQVAHDDGPRFLEKSVQPIYKMKGMQEQLSREHGEEDVLKRLDAIDQAKGLLNTMLLDADGEDYSNLQFTYTGVSDIINTTCNMLSAATGIPQTILFGRSPAGQNATGQSDLENYYNKIAGMQEGNLRNNIGYLLRLIFQAGVNTKKIDEVPKIEIAFESLWSLSETEQAQLDATKASTQATKASTASQYIQLGVLDPTEVRKALAKEDDFDIDTMLDDIPEDELMANMPQQQGGGDDPMSQMMAMLGGGQGQTPDGGQEASNEPQSATPDDEEKEEAKEENSKGMQIGEPAKQDIPNSNPTSTELGVENEKNNPLVRSSEPTESDREARNETRAEYQGSEENTAESVLGGLKAQYALNNIKEEYKDKNTAEGFGLEGRAQTKNEGQAEESPMSSDFSEKIVIDNPDSEGLTNRAGQDTSVQAEPHSVGEELEKIKAEYGKANKESETDEGDVYTPDYTPIDIPMDAPVDTPKYSSVNDPNYAAEIRLSEIKEAYRQKNAKSFEFPEKTDAEKALDEIKRDYKEELELEYRKPTTGDAYTHEIDYEKPSCGVIVLHNGKVLTAMREEGNGIGTLCGPGGHLEEGENSLDAAIRETQEEFSIIPKVMVRIGRGKTDKETELRPDIFICTEFEGTPTTRNTSELTKPKYYTLDELEEMHDLLFNPFGDAVRLYTNWKQGSYHTDAEDDEDEPRDTHHKYHGNTRLPFGLCKEFSIDLPEGAAPRDAWDALRGKGIKPTDVYTELEKTGNTKGIVEKVNEEHPETKKASKEPEKTEPAEKFKDVEGVVFAKDLIDRTKTVNDENAELIKENGFTQRLDPFKYPSFDSGWMISEYAKDTYDSELKEYYKQLVTEYAKEREMATVWKEIDKKISDYEQLKLYCKDSRRVATAMSAASYYYNQICGEDFKKTIEEHSDIPGLKAAYDKMREDAAEMYNEIEAESDFAKDLFNSAFDVDKLMPNHVATGNVMEEIENSTYGKSHPKYVEKKWEEVDEYIDNMQKVADEINRITSDANKTAPQKIGELRDLSVKLNVAARDRQDNNNYANPNVGIGYKDYMVSGLYKISGFCAGTWGDLVDSLANTITYSDIHNGKYNAKGVSAENVMPGMSTTFEKDAFTQERMDNALWCQTRASSVQKLKPWARETFANATGPQRTSVWEYTKGSGNYNRTLAGYRDGWKKDNYVGIGNVDMSKNKIDKTVKDLTEFLNNNEIPEDMWLQRGTSRGCICDMFGLDEFSFDALKAKVGSSETFMQPSFCSCSASKNAGFTDKKFILNIYAPKGTKGAYIAPASYYGGKNNYKGENFYDVGSENELLLQRNTEFKLLKCTEGEHGKVYLDLAVVGQYPLDYDKVDYPGKLQKKTKKKSS